MSVHHHIICILCMVAFSGCAAPKDSNRSFPRPKYDVSTNTKRNGVPAVRQTWWSKAWFWQRMGGNKRKGKSIRLR